MGRKEEIKELTKILLGIPRLRGCITGSSQIDADFDTWETCPDVDLFCYTENGVLYTAGKLEDRGFEFVTKGEDWKFDRCIEYGVGGNLALTTIKMKHPDYEPLVNITWKKKRDNIWAVLGSFDMSIVMVGYDIETRVKLDLRTGNGYVVEDPDAKFSDSIYKAVPNPLRKQNVDMYGAEMWIRQFNRCIKYWDRGYDTRDMARFYIHLIDQVIEDGALFNTSKSEERYQDFCDEFLPLREQMVLWLKDKEDC